MPADPLTGLIIKVFIWLPLCYWGWYESSAFTGWIAAELSESLLQSYFPKLISEILLTGHDLEVVLNVSHAVQNVPQGMVAELPIPINPLKYNYGLPLCISLILASPGTLLLKLRNCLLSILLLLPIQIWGICFEFLKVLFLQLPGQLHGITTIPQWRLDFIAIGYQIGVLVFPAVSPIIIWGFFYRQFIAGFTPFLRADHAEK